MNRLKVGLKSILWSVLALVLLVSVSLPGINLLAVPVVMVPYVLLYTTLTRQQFALHVLVVLLVAFLIMGPVSLILGFFFLVPALIMGHLYRKRAAARTVVTAGVLAVLGQFLLEMVLFSAILDISITGEMGNIIRNQVAMLEAQGLMPPSWTTEVTESFIRAVIQSIPWVLIAVSFTVVIVTHGLTRRLLAREGIEVPGFKPAKEWMLPKSFVLYYLIALIADLFVDSSVDSFMNTVLVNLIPLLRLVFTIQAIGLFFYIADQKRWSKAVPVLLAIPLFLFPPLSLIGVLDVAFPIRKSFTKS
ncbi:DUF2232 domain-containing protein [Paenibacillus sp. 1P07SE]|uniref:DUF2232 domain-containing protein n=1 Tax=Paenibacillus sp. 1P07SE TaxID=3132209 RepID=UPI0039A400D7